MTTVINTPPTRESEDGSAGWAVAVFILLAVIGVGIFFWTQYRESTPKTSDTNINVTIPNPVSVPVDTNTP